MRESETASTFACGLYVPACPLRWVRGGASVQSRPSPSRKGNAQAKATHTHTHTHTHVNAHTRTHSPTTHTHTHLPCPQLQVEPRLLVYTNMVSVMCKAGIHARALIHKHTRRNTGSQIHTVTQASKHTHTHLAPSCRSSVSSESMANMVFEMCRAGTCARPRTHTRARTHTHTERKMYGLQLALEVGERHTHAHTPRPQLQV